jgi:dihydrofolate reductase
MNIIASLDENNGIGYNGELLEKIHDDMMIFRSLTLHKIVVMGRKTLESLPDGKPLSNRINIIFSTDKNYKVENAIVVNSITQFISISQSFKSDNIFIIGGEKIYKLLFPYCNALYITKLHKQYVADTFFPEIDYTEWAKVYNSEVLIEINLELNMKLEYIRGG